MINIDHLIHKIENEYEELEPCILDGNSKFKELIYWNSINSLVMVVMIEYEYHVILKEEDLKSAQTIKELAEIIHSKMQLNEKL